MLCKWTGGGGGGLPHYSHSWHVRGSDFGQNSVRICDASLFQICCELTVVYQAVPKVFFENWCLEDEMTGSQSHVSLLCAARSAEPTASRIPRNWCSGFLNWASPAWDYFSKDISVGGGLVEQPFWYSRVQMLSRWPLGDWILERKGIWHSEEQRMQSETSLIAMVMDNTQMGYDRSLRVHVIM